jgi:hypothetical protein
VDRSADAAKSNLGKKLHAIMANLIGEYIDRMVRTDEGRKRHLFIKAVNTRLWES